MRFEAKKGQELPEPPAVVLREAADADVGRIKGEVLRLGGHGEAARNTLIAPFVRGEREPRLLAALGLDELQGGRTERARKFLEAAAQASEFEGIAAHTRRTREQRPPDARAGRGVGPRARPASPGPRRWGRPLPPRATEMPALASRSTTCRSGSMGGIIAAPLPVGCPPTSPLQSILPARWRPIY